MTENAFLFLAYNELQNTIRQWNHIPPSTQLSLGQLMIAAAGAGSVVSFFLWAASSLLF
jgi:mitochondrial ornithine carrier protein